jgi:hypothetical protein
MSRDVDVSTFRAFLVRISAQQFQQYRFADFASRRKLQPHHFALLCFQNRRTCGDPVGLVLPQPVPASEGIATDRYRGMGSQSHWAVPRSQDACVIVPELQILTACHTEAGKC